MKYKVGDKVRIRADLQRGKKYFMENGKSWNDCPPSKLKWADCVVTISELVEHGRYVQYKIREDGKRWTWTDEMFTGLVVDTEPVPEKPEQEEFWGWEDLF